MFEIERKFLITRPIADIVRETLHGGGWPVLSKIEQCYLRDTGKWAIRARKITVGMTGSFVQYKMTMKRRVTEVTNVEIENDISEKTYRQVCETCGHTPLLKTRYDIMVDNSLFEVDTFHNRELQGLVIAEIELKSEDEVFARPDWLGEEITGRKGYSNRSLAHGLPAL